MNLEEKLGKVPTAEDPQARAEYFLDLLDAFAQSGAPEAMRIRGVLVDAISTYAEQSLDDKGKAVETLMATIKGVEGGVMTLIRKSVKKLRDQARQQTRSLGTKSPGGKIAHRMVTGLSTILDALDMMGTALQNADHDLKAQAEAKMEEAREAMTQLGL